MSSKTVSHELLDDKSRLDRPPYVKQDGFEATYKAHCFCGAVAFEIHGEPKDNCFCHCRSCQRLHGAPSTLTSIYDKKNIMFTKGQEDDLVFYSPQEKKTEYKLPLKVSCKQCHSPVANEGNNMFLVLPTLVEFEGHGNGSLPDTFKPKFHQYYDTRIRDIDDDLPKFGAERGAEPLNDAAKKMVAEEKKEKEEKGKKESKK